MKAVVFTEYGAPDVLEIEEVDKPVPRDGEVLVKVHATTVTTAECLMRRGQPRWGRVVIGLRRPRKRIRTLGIELAGEIEAVGRNVRRFRVGDQSGCARTPIGASIAGPAGFNLFPSLKA